METFDTMLDCWGNDTPPEAVWAANDLLKFLKMEYGIKVGQSFREGRSNEAIREKIRKELEKIVIDA